MKFLDEHGNMKTLNIGYEWKPIGFDHCKLLGHLVVDNKKKKGKKKWVAKTVVLPSNQTIGPEKGFVRATRTVQIRKEKKTLVIVGISF